MLSQNEKSQEFFKNFEKQIIQGRKLLKLGNHKWADKLFTKLYLDIQKADWINLQKKDQLNEILNNSWDKYIQSLVAQTEEGTIFDVIKYYDSYNRYFGFLAKQGKYYELLHHGKNLIKSYINQPDISINGLTKLVNSLSNIMKDEGNYYELLKYQILSIYLQKSFSPSTLYYFSMNYLWEFLKKIEPSKRPLLLYIFLENIGISYQLKENSDEFIQEINHIIVNRLRTELKNEFSLLSRIRINDKNFNEIFSDLENLLMYLNDIGESNWILSLIENIFLKIIQYDSFDNAVEYIKKYLYFLLKRNRFEISFNVYKFLGNYFKEFHENEYNFLLIEHWADACKNFRDLKEKKYLLRSLEELQKNISTPSNTKQIVHYFYVYNFIWRLKTKFITPEKFEFWNSMFYRAFFEEQDINLSENIIKFLSKKIQPLLTNLQEFRNICSLELENMPFFDQQDEGLLNIFDEKENLKIKNLLIRIRDNGEINFSGKFEDSQEFQDVIIDEYWNDDYLIKIYNDLFWNIEVEKDITFVDFGKLLYLSLPKKLRNIFLKLKQDCTDHIPHIFLMLDNITIPFDLIHDGSGFTSLKYSIGYSLGEPDLRGINSKIPVLPLDQLKQKFNILIFGSLNLMLPSKWDDATKNNVLMYPFNEGVNELNHIIQYFRESSFVDHMEYYIQENLTRENILNSIISGTNDIIHIIGNLFYSTENPKNSYFITNDYQTVSISDINYAIKKTTTTKKPFIFFNVRIFNLLGDQLPSNLKVISKIIQNFDQNEITGIIVRILYEFNDNTRQLISNIYNNLTDGFSQGISVLKARQKILLNKVASNVDQKEIDIQQDMNVESIIAFNSFLLFGKPWKMLE